MKKFNANGARVLSDLDGILIFEAEEISDGYHTMEELYDHRLALTAALLNIISNECPGSRDPTFKSLLHADGTMFDGYFICGLNYGPGELITYHYKIMFWNLFRIPQIDKAPEYDGHTSQDVIERLLKL